MKRIYTEAIVAGILRVTFLEHGFLFHWDYEHGHLTPEQVRVIKPIVEDNWDMILKSNRFELKMEFER